MAEKQSKTGTLNTTDWKKILKGAGLAGAGAVLTFLLEVIPGVDFGQYTLVVAPILSVLLNAGLKFVQGAK